MGYIIQPPPSTFCLILFAKRSAQLNPIRRWYKIGTQVAIQATTWKKTYHHTLVVKTPDGNIKSIRMFPNKHQQLLHSWRASQQGKWTMQLIAQGETGAWTAAQWSIHVLKNAKQWPSVWAKEWSEHLTRLWQEEKPTPKKIQTIEQVTRSLLQQTNQKRKHMHLQPLKRSAQLDQLAQRHAEDMIKEDYFGHTSPQHGSFKERFRKLGWHAKMANENIVAEKTTRKAFALLWKSPVHRKNLINPKAVYIGIGAQQHTSGEWYFVQVFVVPHTSQTQHTRRKQRK